MDLTVNGNFIVKGDQIFDGGMKIVHVGRHESGSEALTEERLKEQVDLVRSKIVNGRLWFPVCKYMMWRKLVPEGDFVQAAEVIGRLFPGESLNAKDLASLNVLSFRKELREWDENDCPIKDRTTFYTYRNLAELLMEM